MELNGSMVFILVELINVWKVTVWDPPEGLPLGVSGRCSSTTSIFFLSFCIYFEREREREQAGRDRERERGRERIPSRLRAVITEPMQGLELMNCEVIT